ncbi:TIGR00725 family protein [Candidatus Marinimicrobia bacterium MT.SAG.4]|nr:TIGR00725 family protein [Candidatus Marinimicrobia bacterium MT.SAG.4]
MVVRSGRRVAIGVLGGKDVGNEIRQVAENVGNGIAKLGGILVCGGMGGVMEAACIGAKSRDGLTVGILPTASKDEGNPYLDIVIATGMGGARNSIIAKSIDAAIAIDGQYGTLSEIAFCLEAGVAVIGLNTWNIKGVIDADSPEDAVAKAFENI